MTVFLDTSGLYALFDKDDDNHSRARIAWVEWLQGGSAFLTNNYVLLETVALLQHRIGVGAVRALYEDVAPLISVDWITGEQHTAAMEALLAAGRRKLSLVDCASFQTMRAHGVKTAFSFDAHFRAQGFDLKP